MLLLLLLLGELRKQHINGCQQANSHLFLLVFVLYFLRTFFQKEFPKMDNRKKGDKFMKQKFYLNKTRMEIETGIVLEVN